MFFEVNGPQQDFLDKEFSQLFFATIGNRGAYLLKNSEKYLNLRPQTFFKSFGQNHPLSLKAQLEASHLKTNLFELNQTTIESVNKFYSTAFQEKKFFSFCHQDYLDNNKPSLQIKDSFEELLKTDIPDKILSVELSSNFFLLKSDRPLTTDYQCSEKNKGLVLTAYYFFKLFFEGPYLSPGGIINRISKRNIKLASTIAKRFQVSTQARTLEIKANKTLISTLAENKILFNNQDENIHLHMPYCFQEEEFQQLEKIFN